MLDHKVIQGTKAILLAGALAGSIFVSAAGAQSPAPAQTAPAAGAWAHSPQNRLPLRASRYYAALWGVDSFSVRWVESGQIVRFSFRVLNANKAAALNDKKSEPFLIDPKAGVKLVVPSLEKIGQLRQTATPEEGKSYWIGFSNKGRFVKRGDRVSVEIGKFRIDGLVVE
jgi:hypothetical protein